MSATPVKPGSPGTGVPVNFSVRWKGRVYPQYSQVYTFYALSDERIRVFVDGKKAATLRGPDIARDFEKMVADYIEQRFGQLRTCR